MNTGEFWARIYELPLKLRSNEMAEKLGNLLGKFVEVDSKECNRLGSFLWVKATIDLRKPLKRGTVIKYQGKNIGWIESWSKRKGLGADWMRKYED
ncbi:hypothetical protein MtrunA17_Chr6g0471591 [Medicago truncatula]|uniref:Uncharacterized protein n=1 Tax=Medicago truncatula TaxID=3880 RepID=A0A396HEE9_MEDTR|nr:hypothetical protein MtrunA17_Chr6g0471591 [Medicago truncatula]